MKAFQYLAALGLGTIVTLGETALPVAAQTELAETDTLDEVQASEQITASAISLVPDVQPSSPQTQISAELSPAPTQQPSISETEAPVGNVEPGVTESQIIAANVTLAESSSPMFKAPVLLEVVPAIASQASDILAQVEVPEEVEEVLDQVEAATEAPQTPAIEPPITPAVETPTEAELSVPEAPTEAEIPLPDPEIPEVDVPSGESVQPSSPAISLPEPIEPSVEPAVLDDASVPVDSSDIDPVEAEFEQEGNSTSPSSQTQSSPADGLNDSVDEAEMAEEDIVLDAGIVTESDAPATTLGDEQPNLFRPDETDEVSIAVSEGISLEAAIEIARQNNPGIRIRQLQAEQSQTAVDEALAAYSPQFSINGNFDNSGTITETNELYREPDFGQDNDSNARDATVSLGANARIDYGILDPDRKARVNAAKIAAEQAKLTLDQELADLRLTVSQAYYQLQEADEQVNISEQAVKSAKQSLDDATALERAGVGTRFAKLQAEVQLANERQNLVNTLSAQQQSRRQLAQILSTPEKLNLTASDPVASAGNWTMTLEQSIIQAYRNRIELDNQVLQRDLSDAQLDIALAAKRPSLTAFAQAGPGLRWDFNRTFPENDGNDTAFGISRGTLGYQAGLRFQWLLGNGGATQAAARQQALNKAIAEENFEAARDQVRREVEDAFYDLAANLRNIGTSEQGVIQADEALRLARLRFKAGVGTQSEVVDAERDLTTAQGNRVSAVLNYNRALVAIQRAIGETLDAPELKIPAYVDGEK